MPSLVPLLLAIGAGMAAGAIHVVLGPDHLAAVAPLAARRRRQAWRAGLQWGLGHSGGVLLVGAAALALRGLLDVEALSGWCERAVGVMLIGIGLWIGRTALSRRLHLHPHRHGGHLHLHAHRHGSATAHARRLRVDLAVATPAIVPRPTAATAIGGGDDPGHHHGHAALGVGILHGLAGSSHLLGVLPALALPTTAAAAYLAAFCLGTVSAMVAVAAAVGGLAAACAGRAVALYRGLLLTHAAAALVIGIWWLIGPAI